MIRFPSPLTPHSSFLLKELVYPLIEVFGFFVGSMPKSRIDEEAAVSDPDFHPAGSLDTNNLVFFPGDDQGGTADPGKILSCIETQDCSGVYQESAGSVIICIYSIF